MAIKPEKERAAERVSRALESGAAEHELDRADAERVTDATSSPQPEPGEEDIPNESDTNAAEDGDRID